MIYLFSGKDSSSDNGYFEVIIDADSAELARSLMREHLDRNGLKGFGFTLDDKFDSDNNSVVHSTVESRNTLRVV